MQDFLKIFKNRLTKVKKYDLIVSLCEVIVIEITSYFGKVFNKIKRLFLVLLLWNAFGCQKWSLRDFVNR